MGTHVIRWLSQTDVPLFISYRRLMGRKSFPRALGEWRLDGGGFTEIQQFGHYRTTPADYIADIRRYQQEIGKMDTAAIQDWMCEPIMLAKTGLTVVAHQRRTVESALRLLDLAPDIPWMPVLQGWVLDDYLRHVDMYDSAGINLRKFPVVGVGSVCRRQQTREAESIFKELSGIGLPLHGFGVKVGGVKRSVRYLASSDSAAWSFAGRRAQRVMCDTPNPTHINCANCLPFALAWRENLVQEIETQRWAGVQCGCGETHG